MHSQRDTKYQSISTLVGNEKEGAIDVSTLNEFDNSIYPEPLPMNWRVHHWGAYTLGAVSFFVGSFIIFPKRKYSFISPWAFALGSLSLSNANILEWWKNNRVGCLAYNEQRNVFESKIGRYLADEDSCTGRFQRAENGINYALSILGAFIYFTGSVFSIPQFYEPILSTKLFILASLIVLISQYWKLYRSGCTNIHDRKDKSFSMENWQNDIPSFGVNAFSGLSGLAYLVGNSYFLPQLDVNHIMEWMAAYWLLLGGVMYCMSSFFLFHKYFMNVDSR